MSRCLGEIAVGTKVDKDMADYVEAQARELGVTQSEFLRRLLEFHRESHREQQDCPECGQTIVVDLREEADSK